MKNDVTGIILKGNRCEYEEYCTKSDCLKYKQLQPYRCLNCDTWKRTDDTRPVVFTFVKPE